MAKVKQTKMQLGLDPSKPRLETVVYTNYDNGARARSGFDRENRFYIKLPQVMADALGQNEVRGKTQEEAMKLFEEAIEKFKALKTEKSKVILYDISVYPNPREVVGFRSSGRGLQISVWAGLYEETVTISGSGGKRYSYEKIEPALPYDGEPSGLNSGWGWRDAKRFERQVPLTEANESFFRWVGDNMSKLIAALAEIESPINLIEAVNAGRLLPLGTSSNAEAQP